MDKTVSSIILKSNRMLGAQLVEHGLINMSQLEAANEVFLERRQEGDPRQASLLKILIFEHGALEESKLLNFQLEEMGAGAFDLTSYQISEDNVMTFDLDECWATWTLPVDMVEDVYFLSSAYYMSPFVRSYWEDRLDGNVLWYVHDLSSIMQYLEQFEAKRQELLAETIQPEPAVAVG